MLGALLQSRLVLFPPQLRWRFEGEGKADTVVNVVDGDNTWMDGQLICEPGLKVVEELAL